MKYVRGERLDVWRRSGPARPAMLRLYQKICDAVAFAHAQGVIHRDLKPENIMIGSFGEALVMDWGVAKELAAVAEQPTLALAPPGTASGAEARESVTRHPATAAGTIIGTPAWMAPEQARGETHRIDARTDIHALGAILYYLLAGRPPFEGTPEEVLFRAAEGEPKPLRQIDPTVPRPLAAICARAMARDPEARYASVTALSKEVERFLDGGAVEAYPEAVWERAARFLGRNRTLVFIILAYLLMRLLVLFFAGR
jgi:serine/threonine protein kinase